MRYRPLTNHLIIRIHKAEQSQRKEKMGSIYLHANYIWMTRNCQSGEIVSAHPGLFDVFPQARIGATAIIHHFVESVKEKHFLYEDADYNYYTMPFTQVPGKANALYGVYLDGVLTPHPDYIFLESKKALQSKLSISEGGGLFVVTENLSRSDIEEKMVSLTQQIQNRAKAKMNDDRRKEILKRESEIDRLSQKINSRYIDYYTVASINPITNNNIRSAFGFGINPGERVCCSNFACLTEVEFNDKLYIMGLTKYLHFPEYWATASAANFTQELLQPIN